MQKTCFIAFFALLKNLDAFYYIEIFGFKLNFLALMQKNFACENFAFHYYESKKQIVNAKWSKILIVFFCIDAKQSIDAKTGQHSIILFSKMC